MGLFELGDITKATLLLLGLVITMVLLFIPLDQSLPPLLHDLIPAYVEDKSIVVYLSRHIDFFMKLLPLGALLVIVLVIWRRY